MRLFPQDPTDSSALMMTSIASTRVSRSGCHSGRCCLWRRGFTLLEMMVVLSLMVLLASMGIVYLNRKSEGGELMEAVKTVEMLGARGHMMAMMHQRPFWLRVDRSGRAVLEGAQVQQARRETEEEDLLTRNERLQREREEERQRANGEQRSVRQYATEELPTDQVLFRRWGQSGNEWSVATEDEDLVWEFSPSGLCEPVKIRMELGTSWVEIQMDPLTGRIEDEVSELN